MPFKVVVGTATGIMVLTTMNLTTLSLVCVTLCLSWFANCEFPGMNFQETNPNIADKCFTSQRCNAKSKYRTIDGSCNNLKAPMWGKMEYPFVRLLPSRYTDGVDELPKSVTGKGLPNTRDLSLALFKDMDIPSKNYTVALAAFGQFIAHDASLALFPTPAPKCCPNGEALQNHGCSSIPLSSSDPEYGQFNRTCMEIARTKNTKNIKCNIKPVEQLSQVTHFLDLSTVYGSNAMIARSLRTLKNGLLKTTIVNGKQFCPHAPKSNCDPRSKVCYKAGDIRVNQNLELTALQILLLREHNRVATALHQLNKLWNDERLYQEARRIVISQYEQIAYYEFLPLLTGEFQSASITHMKFSKYDHRVNPATINEFTAGCYRYFHTIVQGRQQFIDQDGNVEQEVPLSEWFERPDLVQENFDGKTIGMTREPSQEADPFFTDGLIKFLEKQLKPFGDDLEAIDIMRGRDHGLAPYNHLRRLCGSTHASNFSQLEDLILLENVEKMAKLYEAVDDIDLFVGTLFEKKEPMALLGPTCNCVVKEQFRRWKYGDRFWFEHKDQVGSFTVKQLDEIRKASFARLLCDNGDHISRMQRHAFWQVDEGNPLLPCSEIPSVSLSSWKFK